MNSNVCTIPSQDDSDVLLAEGADSQQHCWALGSDEAEGHILSCSAAAAFYGNTGGL